MLLLLLVILAARWRKHRRQYLSKMLRPFSSIGAITPAAAQTNGTPVATSISHRRLDYGNNDTETDFNGSAFLEESSSLGGAGDTSDSKDSHNKEDIGKNWCALRNDQFLVLIVWYHPQCVPIRPNGFTMNIRMKWTVWKSPNRQSTMSTTMIHGMAIKNEENGDRPHKSCHEAYTPMTHHANDLLAVRVVRGVDVAKRQPAKIAVHCKQHSFIHIFSLGLFTRSYGFMEFFLIIFFSSFLHFSFIENLRRVRHRLKVQPLQLLNKTTTIV